MKKILLSLALLASVSLGISAQGQEGGNKERNKSNAFKELNLTPDQKKQMKDLFEDFKTKNNALRTQQRELRKSHQADIQAILTPEQQTKWKEMVEKRTNRENKGDRNLGNRARGNKPMKLDAATTAKLDDLRSTFEKDKKTIEVSGVAPDVQQEKIQELKNKFRSDKREIIRESRPKKNENPTV